MMAPSQIFLWSCSLSAAVFLSLISLATSTKNCPVEYCGGGGGSISSSSPRVKFPFQIINNLGIPSSNNPRCGYPSFELSCFLNQTILMLPHSGPFTVLNIDYNIQTLYINDPQNCLPRRYLENFSLLGSPFDPDLFTNVTFLNCSSNSSSTAAPEMVLREYMTVPCLSDENYTVLAVATRYYDESALQSSSFNCKMIGAVMVPVSRGYGTGLEDAIRLAWTFPFCAPCEDQGQVCGFKSDSGLVTGCSDVSSYGMSRGTKYAIIIGAGVPGTLFIIGLGCYLCGKARTHDLQRHHRRHGLNTEFSTAITISPPVIAFTGLDRPTIESYPKTLLGESGRLPKPNDNTCSICLSEYEAKETLRTIPECKHYFHSDCIDKWLRMNASCPVCRNSPDGSSFDTPSSSSTSTSTSSPAFSSVLSA